MLVGAGLLDGSDHAREDLLRGRGRGRGRGRARVRVRVRVRGRGRVRGRVRVRVGLGVAWPTSMASSGGIEVSRSRMRSWMKLVMSRLVRARVRA